MATESKTSSSDNTEEAPYNVIFSKGKTIGIGSSGILELAPSGVVLKSPWPGVENEWCRDDITIEYSIYTRIGDHPRFVKILSWDPKECVLGMEFMSNGDLDDYLDKNNSKITTRQRLQWAADAAEGLSVVHAANVFHSDFKPKNLLLDADLRLRVADFGSSSIDGSTPSVCAGDRFMPPGDYDAFGLQVDLFGLGSTMYMIATGVAPYHDVPTYQVWPLFTISEFPDTAHILYGEEILKCWTGKAESAGEIYHAITLKMKDHGTDSGETEVLSMAD